MQSVHIRMNSSLSPPLKKILDLPMNVLDNLATDVIIGEKIFKEHASVTFT